MTVRLPESTYEMIRAAAWADRLSVQKYVEHRMIPEWKAKYGPAIEQVMTAAAAARIPKEPTTAKPTSEPDITARIAEVEDDAEARLFIETMAKV
jgi:predicted HicB family RNase H-like nuclease